MFRCHRAALGCLVVLCLAAGAGAGAGVSDAVIRPGEVWNDAAGQPINAHGGGVLWHEGVYYWYGEHKEGGHAARVGVRVYTSTDLVNWADGGVAFAVSEDPASEVTSGCVIERPKVLYNARTGRFVMWFHLELEGHRYNAARTGCAVAETPTGPFTYLGSVRPNAGHFPVNADEALKTRVVERQTDAETDEKGTPDKAAAADRFFVRDFYGGQMARDMTLFLDNDGTAYHVFASEENYTLHIAELDGTFTRHTGKYLRLNPGGHREAPTLFKHEGRYHLITSGCTGWAANAAEHMVADSIWGPWTVTGNPAEGPGGGKTFGAQGTFVVPVAGREGAYVFMADVWNARELEDSRHLWLPVVFEEGRPVLRMVESWSPATTWER